MRLKMSGAKFAFFIFISFLFYDDKTRYDITMNSIGRPLFRPDFLLADL